MPRPGAIRCGPVNDAISSPPDRIWLRCKFEITAAVVLVVMAANLISVIARKSITADEIVLIPAAYYHWVDHDVQLIGQHPPLSKLLAGLPLLFLQPNEWKPEKTDPAGRPDQHEWDYVMNFWRDNRVSFEAISFWSRVPMIGLTLALGVLVFVFTRDLLGRRPAFLAVLLFSLEPTILAHGRIVQTDIAAAFGLVLTVYALWRYVRAPGWKNACFVGIAAAAAILAKYSMLVVVPAVFVTLAVLFYRQGARRTALLRDAALAAIILLLLVNAAYFFHNRPVTLGDLKWIGESFPESTGKVTAVVRLARWFLPTDLVMGIFWQLHHGRVGHPAGLLGMHGDYGWWYYFPVAFFFKATIPLLVLAIVSILWAILRLSRAREWQWLALLVPLILYSILLMASPIDIGVRYYLPGYIFFVILSAALLDFLFRHPSKVARGLATLSVLWMGFETVRVYPHYLPYLNQLAFARPHWWYLSDSNVEWGDDSKALATWLRARGETRVRGLLLGCFATLDFYQINYVDALAVSTERPPRFTALGASFLNGSTVPPYERDGKRVSDDIRINTFDSYRTRKPEAIIGNSIYVYRDGD